MLAGLIAGWTMRAVEVVFTPQCDWAEKTSLVLRFGKRIRLRRGAIKPELEPQIRANELLVVEDIIGAKVWEEDPVEARSYQSELKPQISADESLVAETFVVRSVQCKYFVWLLVCLLAGEKLSTSDCLLKLESNAAGGLWSSQGLSSRTRNCNQRRSSGMELAERYDRF